MRRAIRRRIVALDAKPGMKPRFWEKQKRESERRMAIIDEAPRIWRDLVNDFDHDVVSELAGEGYGADEARAILMRVYGDPV